MAILERANWGGATTCATCVAAFLAARFDRFSISTETTGGEILVYSILGSNMASEAISEYLIFKIFLGEHTATPP